jgi:hypothetical protein
VRKTPDSELKKEKMGLILLKQENSPNVAKIEFSGCE